MMVVNRGGGRREPEWPSATSLHSRRARRVISRWHVSTAARPIIERRFQGAGEIAPHPVMESGGRVEPALATQPVEPARADCDMTDLVGVDAFEDRGAVVV